MREILFRGKGIENGKWVYGFYSKSPEGAAYITEIVAGVPNAEAVDPDTVGQFTGYLDRSGKKVFEGDIVPITGTKCFVVKFVDGRFCFMVDGIPLSIDGIANRFAINGNIWEHNTEEV